jgi:DNA-binding transcriptional regulator LsrR (DeoR family)
MSFLATLKRIAENSAPGRAPSYMEAQVMKALEIASESPVGRAALGKRLGLGEGVVRTLVKHMRAERLIEVTPQGIGVAEAGRMLLDEMRLKISGGLELPRSPDAVGKHNYAVLVHEVSGRVRLGVEQRDAALMAGAKGATTAVYWGGVFIIPGMGRPLDVALTETLKEALAPREGSVAIIGSGDSPIEAEIGAKAAALGLLA